MLFCMQYTCCSPLHQAFLVPWVGQVYVMRSWRGFMPPLLFAPEGENRSDCIPKAATLFIQIFTHEATPCHLSDKIKKTVCQILCHEASRLLVSANSTCGKLRYVSKNLISNFCQQLCDIYGDGTVFFDVKHDTRQSRHVGIPYIHYLAKQDTVCYTCSSRLHCKIVKA